MRAQNKGDSAQSFENQACATCCHGIETAWKESGGRCLKTSDDNTSAAFLAATSKRNASYQKPNAHGNLLFRYRASFPEIAAMSRLDVGDPVRRDWEEMTQTLFRNLEPEEKAQLKRDALGAKAAKLQPLADAQLQLSQNLPWGLSDEAGLFPLRTDAVDTLLGILGERGSAVELLTASGVPDEVIAPFSEEVAQGSWRKTRLNWRALHALVHHLFGTEVTEASSQQEPYLALAQGLHATRLGSALAPWQSDVSA